MVKEYKLYRSYGHTVLISAMHAVPWPLLLVVSVSIGVIVGVWR